MFAVCMHGDDVIRHTLAFPLRPKLTKVFGLRQTPNITIVRSFVPSTIHQ